MDPDLLLGPQGIEVRFDQMAWTPLQGSEWSVHKPNDTLSVSWGKIKLPTSGPLPNFAVKDSWRRQPK